MIPELLKKIDQVPLWSERFYCSPPDVTPKGVSLVFGNNAKLYQATALNGPGTEAGPQDPMTSDGYWQDIFEDIPGITPIGGIIMWSGAIADIPENWALCNGNNGTPDLRGRFVLGVLPGSTVPGDIGGSNSHSHTVTVNNLTLSTSQTPAHTHVPINGTGILATGTGPIVLQAGTSGTPVTYGVGLTSSGGNGAHNHTASVATAANNPPYYVLAFIMRVA